MIRLNTGTAVINTLENLGKRLTGASSLIEKMLQEIDQIACLPVCNCKGECATKLYDVIPPSLFYHRVTRSRCSCTLIVWLTYHILVVMRLRSDSRVSNIKTLARSVSLASTFRSV